jgi:uncharacterized membrane protein
MAMIATHNLADGVRPDSLGAWSWLWTVLHVPGALRPLPGVQVYVLYPLVPWTGVMAAGYGLGPLFLREPGQRRKWLLGLGLALTLAFVVIRATNIYGDPQPWSPQRNWVFTIFSFVNCEKYPPSLLYLLMTLGPALMALAWFDGVTIPLARPFVSFGRVPLFYYVIHLPLIHALAVLWARPRGYDLPIVYFVWLGVVLALFPVCYWFAGIKQRRRAAWLSYF